MVFAHQADSLYIIDFSGARRHTTRGTPATYATRVAEATYMGRRIGPRGFVATESRHTVLGCGYGLRRRHSLMKGMRRRPRRKEIAMGLKRLVGLMGLIGLMG